MDAEQYQKKEKEFRRVSLKALRALVRAVTLFDPTTSRGWDWQKEMRKAEEELWKVESDLKE